MRVSICAVGRARGNPAAEICQTYLQRLPWPIEIREVEVRKNLSGEKLAISEAELLRAAMPARAVVVALDGKGKTLSSEAFAQRLGRWQDDESATFRSEDSL